MMAVKVTVNTGLVNNGSFGRLFNRLTPTRGVKVAVNVIASFAQLGNVEITVRHDILEMRSEKLDDLLYVPSSSVCARSLYAAGIRSLSIPQLSHPSEIISIFNTLTERTIDDAARIFKKRSINIEIMTPQSMALVREQIKIPTDGAPKDIAKAIHMKTPKSLFSPLRTVLRETQDWGEGPPAAYTGYDILPEQYDYTDSDFEYAASLINNCPAEKRASILKELSNLDGFLGIHVRDHVKLS